MDNPNTAIARVMPEHFSPAHWQAMREMAQSFHKSGALPTHLNNAERVVMVLQAGAELGIPPVQALNTLYIVNGKVAMEGRAMLKQIMRGGVSVKWKESTDTKCTVVLSRVGDADGYEETYTIEEATKAKLTTKDNWIKYPKDMLRWRALSRASRFYCPDVTEGIHLVEELADTGKGAKWGSNGDVVEIESSSPIADEILKDIESCPDKATYDKEIKVKISETRGLSYSERAAITKAAELKLAEWAKKEIEAQAARKASKDVQETRRALQEGQDADETDEDTGKEPDTAEDVQGGKARPERSEISPEEFKEIVKKVRAMTKQTTLIEYIQGDLNALPLDKEQKKDLRKWVSNKVAQINGKVPDAEDLKIIFGY